jgi:hypothetical protein
MSKVVKHVPLKLWMFLVSPSMSRLSYVLSSLGLVLQNQSWWSIHVLLFQVIQSVFLMCFRIFYYVAYFQSVSDVKEFLWRSSILSHSSNLDLICAASKFWASLLLMVQVLPRYNKATFELMLCSLNFVSVVYSFQNVVSLSH